jgi:hypothetical protein
MLKMLLATAIDDKQKKLMIKTVVFCTNTATDLGDESLSSYLGGVSYSSAGETSGLGT